MGARAIVQCTTNLRGEWGSRGTQGVAHGSDAFQSCLPCLDWKSLRSRSRSRRTCEGEALAPVREGGAAAHHGAGCSCRGPSSTGSSRATAYLGLNRHCGAAAAASPARRLALCEGYAGFGRGGEQRGQGQVKCVKQSGGRARRYIDSAPPCRRTSWSSPRRRRSTVCRNSPPVRCHGSAGTHGSPQVVSRPAVRPARTVVSVTAITAVSTTSAMPTTHQGTHTAHLQQQPCCKPCHAYPGCCAGRLHSHSSGVNATTCTKHGWPRDRLAAVNRTAAVCYVSMKTAGEAQGHWT